ncbi:MAG: hypothetical protein RR810_07140 [Clostridia bacterium]
MEKENIEKENKNIENNKNSKSNKSNKKNNKKTWIIVSVVIVLVAILSLGAYVFCLNNNSSKNKANPKNEQDILVPLNEWAKVSKLNAKDKVNADVLVKVNKVIRGVEAADIVKSHVENTKFLEYTGPAPGMEMVVIEYELDIKDYVTDRFGADLKIDAEIVSITGKMLEDQNSKYIIPVRNISSEEKIKRGEKGVGYLETQVPVTTQDFCIKIGAKDGTRVMFKTK